MGFPFTSLNFSRSWYYALILVLASPLNSPGQDTPGSRPTGKPVPKKARFVATKGVPKKIILDSDADSSVSVVEFLIREFPRQGETSAMQSIPSDRSKASLTYTARRNTAATSDSFTFAVRYPGGLYSKPIKVEIDLKELEPFIKAPARVEFGRVMVGRSAEKEFYIQNTGNASYQNKISLSPPWFLVEPASGSLGLAPGSGLLLKVRYSPSAEGPTETELLFNRNPGGASFLEGSGFNPFALKTSRVILRWEPKSRTRIGEVSIECDSPSILPVTLNSDPRLKIVGGNTQFLEPEKTTALRIFLPSPDTNAFEGQLDVVFGSFSQSVLVAALAPPAHIIIDPTGQPNGGLDFGQVEAGKAAMQSFQIRNMGGSSSEIRFSANPPFFVMAPSGRAFLNPQQAEAFAVRLATPVSYSGLVNSEVKIEADNGQTLKLRLRAAVVPAGSPITQGMANLPTAMGIGSNNLPSAFPTATLPGEIRDPDAPPDPSQTQSGERLTLEELEALRSPQGFVTFPTVERDISENIPAIDATTLKLEDHDRQQLAVSWPLSGDDFTDFEIEMRMFDMNTANSSLRSIWVPHHDVAYRQAGKRIIARIKGLSPNRTYEFRLFTLGAAGKVSPPAFFVVATKRPLDWTWIYISCGIFLLAGVSWFIWKRNSAQWLTFD